MVAMTEYRIHEGSTGVSIELSRVGGNQAQILDALQDCQQGRCTCPTQEYEKLESMQVTAGTDRMEIVLKPHADARFDVAEIAACLDYTIAQSAAREPRADENATPGIELGAPGSS